MRLLLALLLLAFATPAAAQGYKAPRNAHGQPDLGGVWNANFVLPLEARPDETRLVLPEAEARAYAKKIAAETQTFASFTIDAEFIELAERAGEAWLGLVRGERRTRQIVIPADGMLPVTPQVRGQIRFVENVLKNAADPPIPADHPEQRRNWERCLVGQGQPPVTMVTDINPRQILQTKDAVVILTEYGPDLRIIPFTDKHGPVKLAGPLGDAIARWEGETLVIETVGLPAADTIRPLPTLLVPPTAVVEERYTRVSDKELLYQYTVREPRIYTAPWLAEYSLYRQDHPILEFACHEGNYSLPNILSGARAIEKERAASSR